MPNMSTPRLYADNTTPGESNIYPSFDYIETFFNVIGLDSTNIQDGAITSALLAAESITNAKIQSNAITTAKIANTTITRDKFSVEVRRKFVPVGAILAWPSDTIPAGYLLCDGAAVSRTTYADLFAVMGTSHGAGNGTTTFNLPDLRGLFIRGQDDGAGRDPAAATRTALLSGGATGDNVGSYQPDAVEDHSHTVELNNVGSIGGLAGFINYRPGPLEDFTFDVTSGGSDTRPKNVYETFIVRIA